MKKQLLFFLSLMLFGILVSVQYVHAATTTPTPEVTNKPTIPDKSAVDKLNEQINNLKDRIASRVAELRLVEKRGVIGIVEQASSSQMTITDTDGNTDIIDVDEITKFSSAGNNDFGISDLTKGTKVSVLGNYNKESRRILARFVDVVTIPVYVTGVVANVDTDNGTMTVATEDNKTITIDVENVTKTSSYTKDSGIEKSGFSKVEVGNRVLVQGYPDKKDKNIVVATRILTFPDLPKDPKIVIPDKALLKEGTITPSAGNGKKLTPIR